VTTYRPQPIDASSVDLSGHQLLVEALARNAHEIWADLRMRDGWAFGPMRDDVRKLHPCLVSFDDLQESDKECDRTFIAEVLKAAITMGVCITP